MKKLFFISAVIIIVFTSFGASVLLAGCAKSSQNHEGFAIYLTKDNIPADKMPALNQIQIADTPLVALSDIVNYDDLTCQLTLSDDASQRMTKLVVLNSGLTFVAYVNRQPYIGESFGHRFHRPLPHPPVSSSLTR